MSSTAKGRKAGSILDFFPKSAKKPNVAKKKNMLRLVSSPSTVATDEEEPSVSVKSPTPMKPQTKKPEPNYPIGTQVEKVSSLYCLDKAHMFHSIALTHEPFCSFFLVTARF
jgi:hypothetical protein